MLEYTKKPNNHAAKTKTCTKPAIFISYLLLFKQQVSKTYE